MRALNFIADIIVCIKQFSIDISREVGDERNRRAGTESEVWVL